MPFVPLSQRPWRLAPKSGTVSSRLADASYRISALNNVPRKRDRYDRVAEAAAPVWIGCVRR
jgi:hypothetical protein